MKIRITGKKGLPKAQAGLEQDPTSIKVEGVTYTPTHPEWAKILAEYKQTKSQGDQLKAQVDNHFSNSKINKLPITVTAQSNPQTVGTSTLQSNNPFAGIGNFFNKSVKPLFQKKTKPTVTPNINIGYPSGENFFTPTGNEYTNYAWMPTGQGPAAQPVPSSFTEPKPVDLSGFKPPVVANYKEDPLEAPVDPAEEAAKKAEEAYRTKYPNAPINQTTWAGLDDQVAQRADPFGYEMDQRIKNDPKYARRLSKSLKGNVNTFKNIGKASNALTGAIYATSALTDFIDNKNKQNDFNAYMRDQQMSDNLYPVVQGSRGDYVQTGTSYGAFRPDQMTVNKGMFAQMGGQLNLDNMKIRITSGPDKMEYGGQAKNGYGFDLGSGHIYEDMNESSFDSVSNTMSEIENPNEPYVLETEGDEEVLRPDGTKFRLKGKSHAEGGIKNTASQIPTGSFVYSKKLKETNPEILAAFNKTYKRGGVSYSDISKQYDLNKFKAILDDPNADPLTKSTAQMMSDNYKKKLGQLALAQESKKGFKDGVPQVAMNSLAEAAYGGYIPQYQKKGEVVGYQPWKGDKYENTKNASKMTAEQIDKLSTELGYTGPKDNLSLQRWLLTQPKVKARIDELHKMYGLPKAKKMDDGLWGYRWDIILGDTPPEKIPPKIPPPKIPPIIPPPPPLIPPTIKKGKVPPIPYDFLAPDKMSMLAAGMNPPKKYLPYYANYKANLPTPTFYSPERELAANAEQANIMTQSLANFAGPQAFMSNASAVQGKAAEQAANTLGKYNNLNVGVANQFSPIIAETLNKQAMYAAERANELFKGNVIANQQYDNAKRSYVNNLAKSYANAWNNRMNLGDINDTMAFYYKDPATGKNVLKGPVGSIKNLGMYGSSANITMNPGASVGNFGNAFKSLYKNYLAQLEDDEDIPADKKLTAEEKKKKAAKLADLDIQSRRSSRSFNSQNPFQFNQRNTQYTGLEDFSDQDFTDEEE